MTLPMVRWEGSHQSLKYPRQAIRRSFSVFLKKSPSESERFTMDSAMVSISLSDSMVRSGEHFSLSGNLSLRVMVYLLTIRLRR